MKSESNDESLSDAFRRARKQIEESDTDETSDVSEETNDRDRPASRLLSLAAVFAGVFN